MVILSEPEVAALLPMTKVIELMELAFRALAEGRVDLPVRNLARPRGGVLGAMPGSIAASPATGDRGALGAKLVSVFPANTDRGKHSHQAVIVLFDPTDGTPCAVMDARYITEVRTAATSALATRLLAPRASVVAIIGSGVQARAHIEALRHVLSIGELRIWGRARARAAHLAENVQGFTAPVRIADSVHSAARGAHVICTVTGAKEPLLFSADVDDGAHVNAVGFASIDGRELGADLVRRARIVVDSVPSALAEAGDIRLAIRDGALPQQPELVPLADVVTGAQVRRSPSDVTIFESVGIAVEDLVCAEYVAREAAHRKKGATVVL